MANVQTKIICYFLYRIYIQLGGTSNFCDILNASEQALKGRRDY